MKIVIDIPEATYKKVKQYVKNGIFDYNGIMATLHKAIANGTPLPKGHGRLIDADMLMKYCQNQKVRTIDCNDIARFPTIIEADKEAEE